jgi:hypothetical protein
MVYSKEPIGAVFMAKLRKQVSLDFLDYSKTTINNLLASNIPQSCKQKLCIMMEKLLRDTKSYNGFSYLYWSKFGFLDWNEQKGGMFSKMNMGQSVNVPQEFITGPDYKDDPNFVSDIQGEFSRNYK